MPVSKVELIEESGFPRGVKKMANQLAKLLNRDVEIVADTSGTEMQVLDTEEKVVISIPAITKMIVILNGTPYYTNVLTDGTLEKIT